METVSQLNGRLTWFLRKAAAPSLELRWVCLAIRFDDIEWFVAPRTPLLWQRRFLLVNCYVVRRFSCSLRMRCRKNLPLGGAVYEQWRPQHLVVALVVHERWRCRRCRRCHR